MILQHVAIQSVAALVPFVGSAATWSLVEPDIAAIHAVQPTAPVLAAPSLNLRVSASPQPAVDAGQATLPISYRVSFVVDAKRIMALQPGWAGARSVAVGEDVLGFAQSLVTLTLRDRVDAVAPQLIPGGDGSLQLEWHRKSGEIEFLIEPDGNLSIWGRDHRNGQEFEGCGAMAVDLFLRWAPRISSQQSDELDVSTSAKRAVLNIAA